MSKSFQITFPSFEPKMANDIREDVHLNTVQRPYNWTASDFNDVMLIISFMDSDESPSSSSSSDSSSDLNDEDPAFSYFEEVLCLPQRMPFTEPPPDKKLRWGKDGPKTSSSWYSSLLRHRLGIEELRTLSAALGMQEDFRSKSGHKYWGLEGLALFMEVNSSPTRLHSVASAMGRYSSSACEIFADVAKTIFDRFQASHSTFEHHKWVEGEGVMKGLQDAVVDKLESILEYSMDELEMGIFIFIDGKKKRTCRPSLQQRAAYSGYLKGHGINYQGGTLPNGINILFLPMDTARRSDPYLYRLTGTEDSFRAISARYGGPCRGYADKLYPFKEHLVRTPKGRLSTGEEAMRKAFSAVRNSVEWGFGFDTNNFTGHDYFRRLKILQSSAGIGIVTWVCSFLSNCITCMRGSNQVSSYFNLNPPTLNEFLEIPE